MEPRRWKSLGLEMRRPTLADWSTAGTLGFLLHLQPQVPELVALIVTATVLRCVRYRRVSE